MYVLRFWKKSVDTIGTLTTKLPGQRQLANTKMSIPPMPTPYGVSRQTIFLCVTFRNRSFGVVRKFTRKLSLLNHNMLGAKILLFSETPKYL